MCFIISTLLQRMLKDELLCCSKMRFYAASSKLAAWPKGIGVLEEASQFA
jgi:hypothetical protein